MSPARTFPEQPAFEDHSEREVWKWLQKTLPSDSVIFTNLKFNNNDHRHEIDFLVAMPNLGVALVEVKGGKITPNADSTFTQSSSHESHSEDPAGQAERNMYGISEYVQRYWSRGQFKVKPLLAFPYSDIESAYHRPTISRSAIIDQVDLVTIADRITSELRNSIYRPTHDDIELLIQHLVGISGESLSPVAQRMARAKRIQEITDGQNNVLDMLRHANRYSVLGAAGCGKTYVAMEQARRRVLKGDRVAFMCYNRGLARYIRNAFDAYSENERPASIDTFHSNAVQWGVSLERRDDVEYWDVILPTRIVEALTDLPIDQKFDTIVIDEAQDFHEAWWGVVTSLLKDPLNGRVYAFGDIRQDIHRRGISAPLNLCPATLDFNVRNSQPIAELASICVEEPPVSIGLDGPPVRFVRCTDDSAIEMADKEVERLLSEGWSESDICVLTTGASHPKKKTKTVELGANGYWNSYLNGEGVFYAHTLGFKGLERPVVVLAINGWKTEPKKDLLYTAITRARDQLVICADPETLKHGGGKELVKKLVAQ